MQTHGNCWTPCHRSSLELFCGTSGQRCVIVSWRGALCAGKGGRWCCVCAWMPPLGNTSSATNPGDLTTLPFPPSHPSIWHLGTFLKRPTGSSSACVCVCVVECMLKTERKAVGKGSIGVHLMVRTNLTLFVDFKWIHRMVIIFKFSTSLTSYGCVRKVWRHILVPMCPYVQSEGTLGVAFSLWLYCYFHFLEEEPVNRGAAGLVPQPCDCSHGCC